MVDFGPLYQDLQTRAASRLLTQFKRDRVLLQLLWALVFEVQVLSDAIVDVIKFRTLEYAEGANQDVIGRLVGAPRQGWELAQVERVTEDGTLRTLEDGTQLDAVLEHAVTALSDDDYLRLLRLRILSNFSSCTIPDLTLAIKQVTGVTAIVQHTGPEAIDVMVNPDTPADTVDLLLRRISDERGDDVFMFPYPVTAQVRVAYTYPRVTEAGVVRTTEDGEERSLENVPL